MPTKIYRSESYVVLDNGSLPIIEIPAKSCSYSVNGSDYIIINKNKAYENTTVNFSDIQDENGVAYASEPVFVVWLRKYTGTDAESISTTITKVNTSKTELGYDAWGRSKSVTDKSLFSGLFTVDVPVTIWKEDFNGTERVPTNATSVNGKLNIVAGATFNDETVLDTFRHLRYQANRGHLYSTAGFIINPTGSMIRDFGTFTSESGTFFRVKADGLYGVIATTRTAVYSEDEYLLDTTGIDLTKGNTYDIQFQWRGVGNYNFFINQVLVKTVEYLGNETELSMFNPSNPVAFRSVNFGDNDAMQFDCVDVTSEGGDEPKGRYGSVGVSTQSGSVALTGFNTPVLAIRAKLTVNGLHNTRDTLSLLASAYSDQKSFLRIWATRDFTTITDGTQTWTDFGDGHLEFMELDPGTGTPMVFNTAGLTPVFGCRVPQDGTYSTSALFEGRTNIYLTAGDMFVFTLHRENGGASTGGVTFEFAEEI